MPGPAKTFAAEFNDTGNYAGAGNQAITHIDVFINDKKAFSSPGASIRIPTTERRLPKLFKFGMNTIEIKVVKRQKDTTIYGQCQYGNPKRPLGLNSPCMASSSPTSGFLSSARASLPKWSSAASRAM
jgi:hypothetical protein